MLREIGIARRQLEKLEPVIGQERCGRLLGEALSLRAKLGSRTIWNVNSTAVGGGVAEMLAVLAGYVAGMDMPIRWAVIGADQPFFATTKRLHNMIHGQADHRRELSDADAVHYEQVLAANAAELCALIEPGDIVLLHDPQTAGLTDAVVRAGGRVIWRSHIGLDWGNEATDQAWRFLRPYLGAAHGFIFTRQQYVPSWVPAATTWIVPPSIDPLAAKNCQLTDEQVAGILRTVGVLAGDPPPGGVSFLRGDGTSGHVRRAGQVTHDGLPGRDDPMVVQVSRWDRLKDPAGVLTGFVEHVAQGGPGYLLLAGPAVAGVADDPEGAEVYAQCVEMWHGLPADIRSRVLLAALPLEDVDENAAMVNAIQRHAAVIVQKSIAEGFGLTVAEGMWKARPVVGSAVGGIADQIQAGTGVLLPDPADLAAFGSQVRWLLDHAAAADAVGAAAHEHVRDNFVGDLHMLRLAKAIETVSGA
jgi:trehalose synthase